MPDMNWVGMNLTLAMIVENIEAMSLNQIVMPSGCFSINGLKPGDGVYIDDLAI